MRLPRETYQIQQTIETHLPHLSQPQLAGLVLWVCGAILAGSACQNAVASALSPWRSWNNLRQCLREWLYDGSDRARPCKTQLDVTLCFAPLLRWVLTWWRSGRLAPVSSTGQALAVDPTLKGDQTTAIVISVLYRGCAIPVAWSIRRATQPGSWMDPTVELLKELAPAVPREMTVIVLCDRGISSPKLWKQKRAQGWHPCMRYRKNITFCARAVAGCPPGASSPFPTRPGSDRAPPSAPPPPNAAAPCWWSGTTSRRNPGLSSPTCLPRKWDPVGTLSVSGSSWASKPAPGHDRGAIKTLGWKWDKTRRTNPARVSRHWLVLSVATLLALAYGTRVEDAHDRRIAPGNLRTPPKALSARHRHSWQKPKRKVSVFRRGIDWLRRLLLKGRLWSRVWLLPEPWPKPKSNLEITYHAPS